MPIDDGCDGNDGYSGNSRQPSSYERERKPSKEEENPLPDITDDDKPLLPCLSSQSSLPSSERANEDEKEMGEEEMGKKNTSGNIPEDFSEDLPEDLPFD